MLADCSKKTGVNIEMTYKGSVDIMNTLKEGAAEYDAVWSASSLWISLGDTQHVVKYNESISTSPVVFGIKESLAKQLKFDKGDVSVKDILEAIRSGKLTFCMTSATQSNSGASAYIGFLYALLDKQEPITEDDLENLKLREDIKELLAGVDRSSGSSDWLKDMFLAGNYDAMVNYECLIIETNKELEAQGKEPLYIVYPYDGLSIADIEQFARYILGIANGNVITPEYDLEPEYIAVSSDGKKAYVSLREANAIAVLDTPQTPAENPADKKNEEQTLVGTVISDAKTKASYKVIASDADNKTVQYEKSTDTKAKKITIPDTVTLNGITYKVDTIAKSVFKNNTKITKVTIGDNVKSIEEEAFSGCKNLKTVKLGKNVTSIGDKAFYNCGKITSITLPSKVNKIGKQAFSKCKSLKKITIKTTKLTSKNVGSKAFKGIHSKVVVKVPKSKLKAYKSILKEKGAGSKAEIQK